MERLSTLCLINLENRFVNEAHRSTRPNGSKPVGEKRVHLVLQYRRLGPMGAVSAVVVQSERYVEDKPY